MNVKTKCAILFLLLMLPLTANAKSQRIFVNDKKIEKTSTINIGCEENYLDLKGYPRNAQIKVGNKNIIKTKYYGTRGYVKSWNLIAKKSGSSKIYIKNGRKTLRIITVNVRKPKIVLKKIQGGIKVTLKNVGDKTGFLMGRITWIYKPVGLYGYEKKIKYKTDMNMDYLFTPGKYKIKAIYKGKTYKLKKTVLVSYGKEDFQIRRIKDAKKVVPSYIIDSLISHKYRYEVARTGGYISKFSSTSSSIHGVHDAEKKIISVNDISATVVVHEIGHFVSCSYAKVNGTNITQTQEWQQLYKTEASKYDDGRSFMLRGSSYASSSANEFFAECFQLYCLKPKQLKKCCPNTYKMMDYIVKKDFPTIANVKW